MQTPPIEEPISCRLPLNWRSAGDHPHRPPQPHCPRDFARGNPPPPPMKASLGCILRAGEQPRISALLADSDSSGQASATRLLAAPLRGAEGGLDGVGSFSAPPRRRCLGLAPGTVCPRRRGSTPSRRPDPCKAGWAQGRRSTGAASRGCQTHDRAAGLF